MALLLTAAAFPSSTPPFRKAGPPPLQPFKTGPRFFFGRTELLNGLFRAAPRAEFEDSGNQEASHVQESIVSSRGGPELNNDIWKLFKEAQQNILHLHQQRLKAVEEMNKIKKEKEILINRLEQLELESHTNVGKDKQSICWELLLRIDSMVLRGLITSEEASKFRRLIIESNLSITDIYSDIVQKKDTELLAELRQFSGNQNKTAFHIIHICAEMDPLVSVGSLASYITGISCALQRKGNLVEVILPKYSCTNLNEIQGLHEIEAELYSYFDGQLHGNKIWTGVLRGIGVTLIQPLHYSSFFNRERVYGYADDFERFSYFSRASLDYIVKSGKKPDILHIHNRETAIIGPLFWDLFVRQGLGSTRILLTCQDLESQFLEQPDELALCGLEPSRLHRSDRLQDYTRAHLVNIVKGGIVYSNKVIILTLHSKEKIIRSLSNGLETSLATYQDKLLAAPYGLDKFTWDPSTDKVLPECYSADNMEGKAVCKVTLQQHLGLPEHSSVPIVGCILSNVSAANLEHLTEVVWMASRSCFQLIVMEHNEDAIVNRAIKSLQNAIKEENMRVTGQFDEALSHLVFAGSDIILCSSLLDPVLQVPLKAIRYGAAPIALTSADNRFRQAIDVDFDGKELSQYLNSTYANMSLSQAIKELKENPVLWNRRIVEGLRKDFSWDGECADIHISAYASIKNL